MHPVTPDLTNLVKILPAPAPGTEIIQSLPGKPDAFTADQLIKATVQQVLDSVVWLKLDGQMLQARTQIPLQPDQQVLLKVVEASPLRVHLQVQHPAPQNPSLDFTTLLPTWGLEADDVNLAIAQALLTQARTVTPADVEAIRTVWRALPALDPGLAGTLNGATKAIEALTYLHLAKLPLNGETLALARHWLNGLPPLTERLAGLQQSLDDVLQQLYRFEGSLPARDELRETLLSVRTQLANWPVSPDQTREKVVAGLVTLARHLGMPAEAKVASSPLITSTALPPANPAAELVPANLAAFLEKGAWPISITKTEESIQPEPLERLISAVNKALGQDNLDAPTTRALHRLAGHLDQLANDLNAGHLANLANTLNPTVEPCYAFPLLLATPNGPRQAQLKIYPQPGQAHVDPQNVRLAILLDLPSLGEIAIDLTVFEQHLSGKILSRQPQTHRLVEVELGHLSAGLSSLGYQIDALTSGLLTTLASPPNQPPDFSGIDLSA